MRLIEPSPSKITIVSNVTLVWILWGLSGLMVFGVLIMLWISANFSFSQEIFGISLLVLIFLYKPVSNIRIPSILTTFDKSSGYITIERKWLWKQHLVEYSLANIKDVLVVQKGRFGKARIYFRIELELFSGERIALSSVNYRPETFVRETANSLRQFLDSTA